MRSLSAAAPSVSSRLTAVEERSFARLRFDIPASGLASTSSGDVDGEDLPVAEYPRDMKLSPLNPLLPDLPLLMLVLSESVGCVTLGAEAAADEKK